VLSGWGGDGMTTWGWIGVTCLLLGALALLAAGGVLLARTSRPPVVRHPAGAAHPHAPRAVRSTRHPEAGRELGAPPSGPEDAPRPPSQP